MALSQKQKDTDIYISTHAKIEQPSQTPSSAPHSLTTLASNNNETASLAEKIIKPQPLKKNVYQRIYHELQEINPDETILWVGRSSQLVNSTTYCICFIFGILIFPLIIAYIVYLQTKNTIYVLTKERLRVYSGVITKNINDLELYRVKDTRYTQPFLFRFFKLSNIQLYTSDITWGESIISGIENGMALREQIRKIVEEARTQKGVKEFDYYTRNTPPLPIG
jgi:hypothetical protein